MHAENSTYVIANNIILFFSDLLGYMLIYATHLLVNKEFKTQFTDSLHLALHEQWLVIMWIKLKC